MKELFIELIETIQTYLAGYNTDCGGEFTEECDGCSSYYECKRNYEFADKIEALKIKASE